MAGTLFLINPYPAIVENRVSP